VNKAYTKGRVVSCWRGDDYVTAASDVLEKYRQMKAQLAIQPVMQLYDYASADFGTIAMRVGEPFVKAEKNRDRNETIVNSLFRNDMLKIFNTGDAQKMSGEMRSVNVNTRKAHAKDDLSDALLYGLSKIPWDWTVVKGLYSRGKLRKVETGGYAELLRNKVITNEQYRDELRVEEDEDFLDPDFLDIQADVDDYDFG